MKVCFVVPTYEPDTTGGQGEVVLRLQKNLQGLSVDSYVLTSGCNVRGYPRTIRTGRGKRLFYLCSAAYINWFRKMDFDVINVHHESGLGIIPFLAACKCRARIVTTLHTSYLSESRSIGRLAGFGRDAVPTRDEYAVKYLLTPLKFCGTFLDCVLSHKIVAVCRNTKEECKVDYRIPEEKITVIYNGVDLTEFNPKIARKKIRSMYSLDDDEPVVLSVGCGTIRKGIPYLLRSIRDVMAQIPDTRLIVVGPTRYREQMLSLTRELGIQENVIFTGKVPREELPFYYSACDIVAVPSLQEGFPIVVLEALASSKPVVASRAGGIPEAIEDGVHGILCDPGNITQLTNALVSLLRDPGLREKMGREARRVAELRYDWRKIAQTYLAEFNRLL